MSTNDRSHDMERSRPAYVILGATGGIGSELTRYLAERGARLLLAGRDAKRLGVLAGEVGAANAVIDATSWDDVARAMEVAHSTFGYLDGAVNCVGSLLLKPAHLTREAEWQETLAVNLGSAFATVRSAAPLLRERGGSIVLVSSAAARIGLASHEAIAAAKAGVIGLTQAAAASYGARHIRINAVAPGLVRTPLTDRITSRPAGEKASLGMHALGRLGEPRDVAAMIAWLLDREQAWVTGQVFGVDGGLGTVRAA